MIDEGTLAGLLTEHAERIPVPASAIDSLLAASPQVHNRAATRFLRPSSRVLSAAAVVVIAAGGVWAVGSHSSGGTSATATRSRVVTSPAPPTSAGTGAAARAGVPAGVPPVSNGAQGGATPLSQQQLDTTGASAYKSTATASNTVTTPSPAAGADSALVIRTGTLDLTIPRHTFGPTIGRITTIAAAAGGYISDEKTYESATTPSGTIVVRVPSARFNATVNRMRALGKVGSASTRGVDVTGQYTDLHARLFAATATRNQYLTVLGQATNIGDILAVQDRIQEVQTTIEQLQGQINELTKETTYGTITMSVAEPAPKAAAAAHPHRQSGISVAWANARNGFSRRIEALISHSGAALVFLVGLLLLAGALRLLIPRMRRLIV